MKFIVDLYLDGYETEEEMKEACAEFIYDQLNFTASSVKIEEYNEVCPWCERTRSQYEKLINDMRQRTHGDEDASK